MRPGRRAGADVVHSAGIPAPQRAKGPFMSQWLLWSILSMATGSPITAGVLVLALWWAGDRFTFRVLPDPFRFLGRWRRMGQLRRTLAVNPHDRRARYELAERLLDSGRAREAAEVLRPNVEAGDEDAHTAFVMGAALGRTGAFDQAERALELARQQDPRFRAGEIDLELGRQRLARGDAAAAREALTHLLGERPGSVEGRYLLARACAALGDAAAARAAREEGWRDYQTLPPFHRRHERRYAWRLKPWRPALVLLAIIAGALLLGAVCRAHPAAMSSAPPAYSADE
jgi:tetratricopeptide (TPR) repeat protein